MGSEKPRVYEGLAGMSKKGHTEEDAAAISPGGTSTNAGLQRELSLGFPRGEDTHSCASVRA